MGWTFTSKTKSELVKELLRVWNSVKEEGDYWNPLPVGTRSVSRVLESRLVGNSLWYVRETTRTLPDGTAGETVIWIGVDLLESNGRGWGYKSMGEEMGPYDYSCPVEFLDLAPIPEGEYAVNWRNKVLARNGRAPLEQTALAF